MAESAFTIKQTAKLTGISEDTIRYYEKIMLLPRAERKDNGHRVYRKDDIYTLKLISCLKKTGISLEAMRPFLAVSADSHPAENPDLVDQLRDQREAIVNQISSLRQLVDFIDKKLEEGRGGGGCSEPSPGDAKPISVVEMSYFPASAG